jgi:SAM-dependent methyltransferase
VNFESISRKYVEDSSLESAAPSNYEKHREGKKWLAEHEAVEQLLQLVPMGARTLDVPIGTGRLIPFLKARNFDAHGLDISSDMLRQARAQAEREGMPMWLGEGDIRNIPFADGHFDLVSCLRFLNWVDIDGVGVAVRELARVSRDKLLVGIRYLGERGKVEFDGAGMVRTAMRMTGVPHMRASRWGLVFHQERMVRELFRELNLTVVEHRLVERRWDGTDYVFFLLQKN